MARGLPKLLIFKARRSHFSAVADDWYAQTLALLTDLGGGAQEEIRLWTIAGRTTWFEASSRLAAE